MIAKHSGRQAYKLLCRGTLGTHIEPCDNGALTGERSDGMTSPLRAAMSAVSTDHLVCRAVVDEVTA